MAKGKLLKDYQKTVKVKTSDGFREMEKTTAAAYKKARGSKVVEPEPESESGDIT